MLKPATPEAYQLLHEGTLALAQVEANGIRVDVSYLERQQRILLKKIRRMENELQQDDLFTIWRRKHGAKTKLGNRTQLAGVLFEDLKFKCKSRTSTGRYAADEAAFESVNHPFVKKYIKLTKYQKLRSTYLEGIARETVEELLHPFFGLGNVRTYRSSSDHPNFQNFPIRNPEMGKIIRSCFIPRPGRVLVEVDFSGIEVRIVACYNHDPRLIEYIKDPSKDMHRDMAAQCYMTTADQVSKGMRYCSKNQFVFPQFYGDYYINCATSLWESIDRMSLALNDETPLKEHLKAQGIKRLGACDPDESPRRGTFEHHLKEVEDHFWGKRFKVYADWKERWYRDYRRHCGIQMLTGFRIDGLYRKNEIINSPIQGAAFHCLLWSLIQLQKELRQKKAKTLLVGQIHDSIIADVPEGEVTWYLKLAKRIMTERLLEHWKWIIVPLEVEAEVTPVNGTWYQKAPIEF